MEVSLHGYICSFAYMCLFTVCLLLSTSTRTVYRIYMFTYRYRSTSGIVREYVRTYSTYVQHYTVRSMYEYI